MFVHVFCIFLVKLHAKREEKGETLFFVSAITRTDFQSISTIDANASALERVREPKHNRVK